MMILASNEQFRPFTLALVLALLVCLVASVAGFTSEADCGSDCQDESGTCCECICCPTKVLMASLDEYRLLTERDTADWLIPQVSENCKQEWFVSIELPPQNRD